MRSKIKKGDVGTHVERLHRLLAAEAIVVDESERRASTFGPSTVAALKTLQKRHGIAATGRVTAATFDLMAEPGTLPAVPPVGAGIGTFLQGTVTGTLVDQDGTPVAGAELLLYSQTLRSQAAIGKGQTDAEGNYQIVYARPASLNLLVKAISPAGAPLAMSAVVFAATANARIDLSTAPDGVVRAPSLHTGLLVGIKAQLGTVPLATLKQDADNGELVFVADASGRPFADVARLYIAASLAASNKLSDATLYGILSQGIPPPLNAALAALPDAGIDDAFLAQVLSGVLSHSRSTLSAALDAAVAANVLPASYAARQDAELSTLDALRVQSVGATPYVRGKTPLQDLLAASSVDAATAAAFMKAWADSGSRLGPTWKTLRADKSLSKAQLATLNVTLSLGELLGGNLPLMKDSLQRIGAGALAGAQGLALLDQADWVARITAIDPQATTIPPVLPQDTPAQRIARFAKALQERLWRRFATTALAGALGKAETSSFASKDELAKLLVAQPRLSLKRTNIDQFVAANQVQISAAALSDLKTVQRLHRLSPHPASVEALHAAGYRSAQAVYFMGRAPFVAKMTPLLGSASLAKAAWVRAQAGYAVALATYARFNLALSGPTFALMASPVPAAASLARLPDLHVLFGSLDDCECAACRSVTSPAAYLVDLLQFLARRAAGGGFASARDVLLSRRPDLQYIALDCANTDVTLPSIDLVNELLESALAPPATPVTLIETIGTSAERRALPQQVAADAYALTASAVFPLTLPFDLPFARTSAFLAAMGCPLDQAMVLCGSGSAAARAAARLSLNPAMQAVINGTDAHTAWERWGFATANPTQVIDPKTRQPLLDPDTRLVFVPTDWTDALSKVPVFLGRAGLNFAQLCQLLEATWVTAGGGTLKFGVVDQSGVPVVSCDTERMTFTGFDAAMFDRASRFLRLLGATALQVWELDWALEAAGGTLDDGFLVFLSDALALRSRLGVPLQELLAFWGALPTRDVVDHLGGVDTLVPSTYGAVFRNPTVLASSGGVFVDPGALSGAPLDPNAVKAALGLSADDIAAILAATGASNSLTLATLGELMRHARLARALSLSIAELLSWIALTDGHPFGGAPSDTLEFLRRLALLQATGIADTDLDYLLRHGSVARSPLALTAARSTALLQAIRNALAKLAASEQSNAQAIATLFVDALADATAASANVVTPVLAGTGVLPLSAVTVAQLLAQGSSVDPAVFPQLVDAFTRVSKAAALFDALRPTQAEFDFLVRHAAVFGWLDPAGLPVAPQAVAPYLAFEALLRALALERRQVGRTSKLFDVLSGWIEALPPDLASAIAADDGALAAALNASAADVAVLAAALGATTPSLVAATQAGSLADMAMLARIAQALDALSTYRVGASTLVRLAHAPPDDDAANAAFGAFQARFAPSSWFDAVGPVEDGLRSARRDALVAMTIGRGPAVAIDPPLQGLDDIYDHCLIDPGMCACGSTTRLLEASLAVQQFVQQCQLGLVPQVGVDATADSGWGQWSWMSQFRLWQANRQVFLYPENYLLPELRADKSEFFLDLESDLKQSDCDAEATTAAFENYLRKLAAARNLTVAAHYNEVRADGSRVLHVFARTRGAPPKWYYRTREGASGATGLWSAWEALDLDIGAEQVVPVVWDQRLHLVWPIFKQISEKAADDATRVPMSPGGGSAKPPVKYWAVEFAMSDRSAGQWQAKRTCAEKCFFNGSESPLAFTFRAFQDARFNLQLEVYMDANLAAQATLTMPDAPLAVYQMPMDHFAGVDPTTIDPTQEPSVALIGPISEDGGLARPTLNYQFTGQALTWLSSTAYQLHPLTLLAASGKMPVAQEVLGQIDSQRIVFPLQELVFDSADPFFVADSARTWFVQPHYFTVSSSPQELDDLAYIPQWTTRYEFQAFHHPFARTFLREIEVGGVDRLMRRDVQTDPLSVRGQGSFDFSAQYMPTVPVVATPYPIEEVDFRGGPSSIYNWEVFYHVPMLVASQLMRNQQFPDAMRWLQYIFDPTDSSSGPAPARFWQTRPFFEMNADGWLAQQIQALLSALSAATQQGSFDAVTTAAIVDWLAHPFDPHRIARLRIAAYAKSTVMKFLDNLIAWGDSLYAQYTMEKVAQAQQLYVFADLILGPRPERVRLPDADVVVPPEKTTYASLSHPPGLDAFSNELVAVENLIAAPVVPLDTSDAVAQAADLPQLSTLFFCIPANEQLLAYWDTVADRMYKVRHCLNLQGVAQPLPLYAPPLDPLQLIEQGAAAGAGGITATTFTPVYRFATYLERALELANDVRAYGTLVLSALEKGDAEALAVLRANQDVDIQNRLLDIRKSAVVEAKAQIEALQNQKAAVQIRHDYYASVAFINDWESAAIGLQLNATILNGLATVLDATASGAHLIPSVTAGVSGFGGTPSVVLKTGGEEIASSASSAASVSRGLGGLLSEAGGMAATMGGYQRRQDEWTLQKNLATAELTQMDSQIEAANARFSMAVGEVELQNRQIANAQIVSDFLADKYTNAQLYDWMLTQLTTVHTQAYQLAFALAQRAQSAWQYELGRQDEFVQFGYWDSQHKGLVAGESLLFDLRRMQTQYLEANTRECELVKHASLALTQPMALVQLLQTGTCNIALDESVFDLDHPGQYFRRLRSVALTVPCVTGPYTGVNATLSLNVATVRVQPPISPYQPMSATSPPTGAAFVTSPAPATASISISHGQNDAGLFDVNLRDERWLPFEGQGAVSTWTLTLDPRDNAFDLSTITDVVLHLRYTARSAGGDPQAVRQGLKPSGPRQVMLSVRSYFADAYYAFFNPSDTTAMAQSLVLPLTSDVLPFSNLGSAQIADVALFLVLQAAPLAGMTIQASLGPSGAVSNPVTIAQVPGGTAAGPPIAALGADAGLGSAVAPQSFTLLVPEASVPAALGVTSGGHQRLDAAKFQDIVVVVTYKVA